ncbi:flagellar export chaperone FliS [Botrimarina sp.]|uniref:flagellar export chaperone FliS n=1 Tax=Botrimarina sp. TaxID=2795802 RepID=UPI0032EE331A
MTNDKNREYLEAKVRTANSAQLHLMLLDGAIRFAREAEKGVLRGDELAYHPPLLRAMDIVEELLVGVRHDTDALNAKLAQLYAYIYARLTSVYVNGDKQQVADAIRVLEIQRETWRLAVARLTEDGPPTADDRPAAAAHPGGKVASRAKAPSPKPHLDGSHPATPGGLSIEA